MADQLSIPIHVLAHGVGLALPAHATADSAGVDLRAAVPEDAPLTLAHGTEGQVRPRSGLAFKHGVTVLNSPGTIDADYRGEVKVLLINHGPEPFVVTRGERIAQLVVARYERVQFEQSHDLAATERGSGGFGHTGRS